MGLALLVCGYVQAESPSQLSGVVAQVVGGRYFSCALDTNGAVQCWGNNDHGQLGAAGPSQSVQPSPIGLVTPAIAIAAGRSHACALLSDGSVACWGANDQGQLGDGTTTDNATPVAVVGLTRRVAALAAGEHHTCVLDTAGAVFCWGANDSLQLGNRSAPFNATPQRVSGLDRTLALAAGNHHTCAVLVDGGAACWGSNDAGQLGTGQGYSFSSAEPKAVVGLGETLVSVTAGDAHSCAQGASGSVYCWGHNGNGQLGDGSLDDRATAFAVTGGNLGQHRAVSLSAGFAHTCAVLDNDEIDCWGDNNDGQLGDGSTVEGLRPTPVAAGPLLTGANVSAGYSHTCAKTPTGGVMCWGSNGYGELGRSGAGSNRPVSAGSHAGGVLGIAGSYMHFCAIVGAGGVSCWGRNLSGELGNGTLHTDADTPQPVLGLTTEAVQVAAGLQHTCAVLRDGTVQCWGGNSMGQIGDGTYSSARVTATRVLGLGGAATSLALGTNFSCAVLQNGQIMCWGNNDSGQLGNGSVLGSAVPVAVAGLNGPAVAITAGDKHACAVLADQSVACWGDNSSLQLGVGAGPNRTSATPVIGIGGPVAASATAIAATQVATCAVLVDGSVQCWGFDQDVGVLGQGGVSNDRNPPATVVGLSGVTGVFAGQYHFCARRSDGSAACWGQGRNGQLGTGLLEDSGTPGDVVGLDDVVALAGSYANTCVVRAGGALYCWGDQSNGMLGIGDDATGILATPSPVLLGQRIAFDPLGALTIGDAPTALNAVASSAGQVTFDTWTPDTCEISGNTVVALTTALCGIRALQVGNGAFAPAPPAYALVPVTGVPKFNVTKTADAAFLLTAQQFTYSILVTNDGSDVGEVNLHDELPSDVAVLGDAIACGADCSWNFVCTSSSCVLDAAMSVPAGGSRLLQVPARALNPGDAANTVTATSPKPVCRTHDCALGSASTGPIPITAPPLFTQSKAIDAVAHGLGDTVSYTIAIGNVGAAGGSAQWADDVPAGLSVLAVDCTPVGTGAQCDAAGSSGNALHGALTLPPAGTATITVTARANAAGDITNAVRVTPTTSGCERPMPSGSSVCGGGTASSAAARVYAARLSLQAVLGARGRLAPNDQFLLTIAGSPGDQVLTSGGAAAIDSRTATVLADAGATFTLAEAMAPGASSGLDSYAPQLTCGNALAQADGGTDPSTLRLNALVTLRNGDHIDCQVANAGAHATLTLYQRLTPAGDPGRFLLALDAVASAAVGDGGSLGPLTLDPGNHTIGVSGANGTALDAYDVSYTCVDAASGSAAASGSGTSGSIALAIGQHLDCTFSARFAHSRLHGAIGGGRRYAQFGHVLTYLVEIANDGGTAASAAHIAGALAPAFDPARTSFLCVATPPATCLAQGSGALSDTPSLPPGGRVSYVVSAGVLAVPPTDAVHQAFAFGAVSDLGAAQNLAGDTQLVIYRDSFEPGGDGSQWDATAGAMPVSLSAEGAALDVSPALRRLQRGMVTDIAHGNAGAVGVRVEALRLESCIVLRLLTVAGDGTEVPGAWLQVDARNPIALLGRAEGSVLLTGANGDTVETVLAGSAALELQVQ